MGRHPPKKLSEMTPEEAEEKREYCRELRNVLKVEKERKMENDSPMFIFYAEDGTPHIQIMKEDGTQSILEVTEMGSAQSRGEGDGQVSASTSFVRRSPRRADKRPHQEVLVDSESEELDAKPDQFI